jgi:hypothetical protein
MTYWRLRVISAEESLRDYLIDAIISSIYKHPVPRLYSLLHTFKYIKYFIKNAGISGEASKK